MRLSLFLAPVFSVVLFGAHSANALSLSQVGYSLTPKKSIVLKTSNTASSSITLSAGDWDCDIHTQDSKETLKKGVEYNFLPPSSIDEVGFLTASVPNSDQVESTNFMVICSKARNVKSYVTDAGTLEERTRTQYEEMNVDDYDAIFSSSEANSKFDIEFYEWNTESLSESLGSSGIVGEQEGSGNAGGEQGNISISSNSEVKQYDSLDDLLNRAAEREAETARLYSNVSK